MPKGQAINSRAIANLTRKFKEKEQKIQVVVDAELRAAANKHENLAVNDVPVDEARLKGVISTKVHGPMHYENVAPLKYAAYMEFGTKTKAKIPAGLEGAASKFQGPTGGSFKDLLKSITEWVKRKGISGTYSVKTKRRLGNKATKAKEDLQAAFPIALHIAKFGVAPHPFFFGNYYLVEKETRKNLKKILKDALR